LPKNPAAHLPRDFSRDFSLPFFSRLLRKLAFVILSEAKNLDFKTLRFAQLTTKNQFPKKFTAIYHRSNLRLYFFVSH